MKILCRCRYLMNKKMAEGAGFEPAVPCGTTVFKTAAFNHSAIPPHGFTFNRWTL
jgi:hypothetical protein